MDGSRETAAFSHILRLDRWGVSRTKVSLHPIFQPDIGVGPMSRFSSRKVSEEGERGCLAAPSLRGSEFVWSILGKFEGKAGREGRVQELQDGLGRESGEREKGGTMTGSTPFWNRKSKESGVFWFLVLLVCLKKKKDN